MKRVILILLLTMAIFLLACAKTVPGDNENSIVQKENATKNTSESNMMDNGVCWDLCPITITGGISGSSYSEIIKINVTNVSSKDIDSVKLMICFTHTSDYDNSQQTITGFYTVDTIWANETKKQNISGENYNFLRAEIYPVCVYFKNGDVWGDSNADFEVVCNKSKAFEIEHFALNEVVVYENDISS